MKMTNEQFLKRVRELHAEEVRRNPIKKWHYLSFADENSFKGAVVVEAHGLMDAVDVSNTLGINPGGQVVCMEVPEGKLPEPQWRNKLLSDADLEQAFGDCERIS